MFGNKIISAHYWDKKSPLYSQDSRVKFDTRFLRPNKNITKYLTRMTQDWRRFLCHFLSWSRVCYLLKSLTCRLDACRDHHYMDNRLIWVLAYCMSSQYKWTIVWCLSRISNYWQNCWYGLWLLYRKPIQLKNLKLFFEPIQKDHHSFIWWDHHNIDKKGNMPSQCKRTITCCLFTWCFFLCDFLRACGNSYRFPVRWVKYVQHLNNKISHLFR